jgi:hypothetical protein
MKTNNATQVNTAPFSPPSAVRDPNLATHPDQVDLTATLHMASLVCAYQSHSRCPPPPNSHLRSRATPYSIAQEMYQHIFDRGGPLACKTHKPFPFCRQWYLQAAPTDAALFAMFQSGHLPEPNLDGLHDPPDSPASATPHTDSTCPWCRSKVTLPAVPSSACDLPWLHIIHRLLLCPAEQGRPPLFKFLFRNVAFDLGRTSLSLPPFSLVSTFPPQLRHPLARLSPPLTSTFSACWSPWV